MGRPDYDDATAGGDDQQIAATQGDTIGWLQHGQTPEGIEYRGD